MNEDYSFIAIADVHIGAKLFNLAELAEDLKEDLSRAFDLAIKLKVNYVFIAGDLFDSNRPSPDLVKYVKSQVQRLGANGIIAAGISGDHEKLINDAAWMYLTGVVPINDLDDHRFVGFDYSDQSMDNIAKLEELDYKDEVEWIFLHGQVPTLFTFIEEKKRLDFSTIDLINDFPRLKGVILGDIHTPSEGEIQDPTGNRKDLPYIGYCCSLGMVKPKEIGHKIGILHFDGKVLKRQPFNLTRKFIRLDIADSLTPINWVQKYASYFKDWTDKRPVIVVDYDKSSEHLLPQIAPLYDVATVKTMVSRKVTDHEEAEKEAVNIRSELKTTDRTEKILKEDLPDKDAYDLVLALLNTEDPTMVLDEFKERMLDGTKTNF